MHLADTVTNCSSDPASISWAKLCITLETIPPCFFRQTTTVVLSLMRTTDSPRILGRKAFRASWTTFISSIWIWSSFFSQDRVLQRWGLEDALPPTGKWYIIVKENRGGEGDSPRGEFPIPSLLMKPPTDALPALWERDRLYRRVQSCPPECFQLSLKRVHPGSAPGNELLQGCHVAQELLSHLGKRSREKKELVCLVPKFDNTVGEDTSDTLYKR